MLRSRDIVLLSIMYPTMALGVWVPFTGAPFQEFLTPFVMAIVFLSFLPIRMDSLGLTIRAWGRSIPLLVFLKMVVLPLAVYALFRVLFPSYAVAALLLSAVSTGVTAPFISNLVMANSALVLLMTVLTSIVAPFSVPALIKLLVGQSTHMPLLRMVQILCLMVLVPLGCAEFMRRFTPTAVRGLLRFQFPIAVVLLALINLAVFSKFAGFFHQRPSALLVAAAMAVGLCGVYLAAGLLVRWGEPVENQLASAVSFCNVNNVLIVVFASHFFGPLEATVAALYLLPYYAVILPMGAIRKWRRG